MVYLELLIVATYFGVSDPMTVKARVRPVLYQSLEQCRAALPYAQELLNQSVAELGVQYGFRESKHMIAWNCTADLHQVRS